MSYIDKDSGEKIPAEEHGYEIEITCPNCGYDNQRVIDKGQTTKAFLQAESRKDTEREKCDYCVCYLEGGMV